MTQFEMNRDALTRLVWLQIISVAVPTILFAATLITALPLSQLSHRLLAAVLALVATPVLLHFAWQNLFLEYRQRATSIDRLRRANNELRAKIAGIYARFPVRSHRQQFKVAFSLQGKARTELETTLAVAMNHEGKEVFVTAFMRKGIAVRVTAAIGSLYRCAAADNPMLWKDHVDRLGCDEIRQYHNHPIYSGQTEPSGTDIRTSAKLKLLLSEHDQKLRSLLLYWNEIGEWKLLEYDETGRYWTVLEFDVAVA